MTPKPAGPRKPSAVIVDVDGTLAIITDRNPYSHHGVLKDKPNAAVIAVVQALAAAGHAIVVVSGRSEAARTDTELWLVRHLGVNYVSLLMRPDGDGRQDAVIKREIFHRDIAPHYEVTCVLDDRNQTVNMWRHLGLTCLQVAPGDF